MQRSSLNCVKGLSKSKGMCSTGCTELLSFRHVSNVRHVGGGSWLNISIPVHLKGVQKGSGLGFVQASQVYSINHYFYDLFFLH